MANRHVIITGTGRAGTTFLVQYLHANGLDTHLGRRPDARLDEASHAGLEDTFLHDQADQLPYVIKSPWIAFDPQNTIPPDVTVDAFIVPVRALEEAAASRVILERAAMHRLVPSLSHLPGSFDHWGTVPGGMVYSLSTQDQARILAVAFHTLVQYAVCRDVPLVLMDFPRFVEDAEYLYDKLSAVLPLERETALAAHASLFNPSFMRTGRELETTAGGTLSHEAADRLAMARELTAARRQLDAERQQLDAARQQLDAERRQLDAARQQLDAERQQFDGTR